MTELFLDIVNMSISAGWLVLAVLALRLILKKAPKWVNVLLWGIVAVRLICPFTIESALSLIPSAETISPEIMMDWTPEISTGIAPLDQVVNPVISTSFAPQPMASANPLQIFIPVAANIWLLGVIAMVAYTGVSYLLLRRKLRTAVILKNNIFQCETVHSPFVLGILKPRIYLPYALDDHDMKHVVAHEQAHIRRKDHWWKPLGFLLLTVHWFNPLMWLAYILLCRDIELACDEKVIAELGNEQRADYTQALVACSVNRHMIAACPLAFGEVGVKERVKSVMNYRKPTFWIIVAALAVCAVVAVCFLTNPLDSYDYLKFTGWSNDPEYSDQMNYEINLGNRAMSGQIYVEQWANGTCVRSAPVVMTQFVESIHITVQDRLDNGVQSGAEIQIETNQYGGSLTTFFPYPENYATSGVYDSRPELDKRIEVSPDKEVILEARSYGLIHRWWPKNSEELITNPQFIENAVYMIVIRAVFSDDPLGVTEEEPVSPPHSILRAKILEIHDNYFLVEPVEGSWELNNADRIEIPMKNMQPSPEPQVGDILEIEYDGQIMETYPAQIGQVYSIFVVREEVTLPAFDKLVHYNQQRMNDIFVGLSRETLHELWGSPDSLMQGYNGEIYNVPGKYQSVMLYYGSDDTVKAAEIAERNTYLPGSTYEIRNTAPLEDLPDTYNLEEATIDRCVIIVDGDVRENADVWEAFIGSVNAGERARVRIVQYYHGSGTEPSIMYIRELTYDGSAYQLRWFEEGKEQIRNYQYLRYFSGEAETESAEYDAYVSYILTDDPTATRWEMFLSYASSAIGAAIPHHEVYTDLIYYPDYANIPSKVVMAHLTKGDIVYASYEDASVLNQIRELLSKAEALGYEPKTYGICCNLLLTGEDGSVVTLGLDAESDYFVLNGVFFDYGPGYDEDGCLDATGELLALLGLENWP